MPDSFFGGKDDLTAALGYEEDGVTTIVFRKKLEGEAREKSSTRLLKLDSLRHGSRLPFPWTTFLSWKEFIVEF